MSFKINHSYNITTLAPTLLGGEYKNVKVKSIMSATEAVKYRDIVVLHTSVKGVVDSLPASINDCTYLLLEKHDEAHTEVVLAVEYIDPYSITEVNTVNIGVKVYDTDDFNIALIRTTLKEIGINNMEIYTF